MTIRLVRSPRSASLIPEAVRLLAIASENGVVEAGEHSFRHMTVILVAASIASSAALLFFARAMARDSADACT